MEIIPDMNLGRIIQAAAAVALCNLACRPVITIGWWEMLLLILIGAIFVGPLLARFWRQIRREQKDREKEKD